MKKLNLCGTWEMTGEDGRSFPAEVPGSVLRTLLDHGVLPDPFDGLNEFAACAETRRRWCFQCAFTVSDEALENPFASPDATPPPSNVGDEPDLRVNDMEYPLTVPEGKLFVLCDDREDAMDSRSSRFGLVAEADVLGLARAIIWPVHRAGFLTDGGI